MWELARSYTFEAAHYLPRHDGKCRQMHGHSYTLEVMVACDELIVGGPKQGMVTDFADIDLFVKPLIEEKLDHMMLNKYVGYPTSEWLAFTIYDELKIRITHLVAVAISETGRSRCEFRPLPL